MQKRKKFLIVSHKFKYRSESTSGDYFCKLLDPEFVKYNGSKARIPDWLAVRLKRISNGRIHRNLVNPYSSHSVKEELWGIMTAFRLRPEYVFYQFADFNYYLFSFMGPFMKTKRIIWTYFNCDELKNRFTHLRHFKRSEIVLVTAKEMQDFLIREFKGKGPKVILFPLGVNTDYFKPAPKKHGTDKRILISGSNRRDHDLIKAVVTHFGERHPEVKIEMVGLPILKDFAEGRQNVIFHGYLDDDSFAKVYSRAEIGLLPLLSAASSNSLNEYIASCLPIVYTELPSMSELDLTTMGLPVAVGDTETFIRETERLFFDDELISRMKENCMRERERISWTTLLKEFHTILES